MIAALWLLLGAALSAANSAVGLGDYSRNARAELESRILETLSERDAVDQVAGTVTCASDDSFFIQGRTDALKIFVKGDLPQPGDIVVARGSPSLEGGRVVFVADEWRRTGSAELPEARAADEADLLFAGGDEADRARDVNWLRVRLEGRAIGLTASGFAIEVGSLPVTVMAADLPGFLDDCAATRPKVTVIGVAELVLDQSVLFGRERFVMGVKLRVNSAADITLEEDLAYLVNRRDRRVRLLVVVAFALLSLVIVALMVLFARQSRRQLRTRTLMAERKRMADDLHDTIEQHLVGARMLMQLKRVKEADDVLMRAKREMRDIVWGLKNDDMMRLTPAQMLRQLAKDETRKGLYRVSTRLEGLPSHLEASAMRDLSLIVREAIGNAVKHGGAKKLAITADARSGGGWLLRVANDGAPFDPSAAPGPSEGHFGVEGMKARARRLGAKLDFSRKGEWMVMSLESLV